MRSFLSIALFTLLSLACTPTVAQDTAQSTATAASPADESALRTRLVGSWQEVSPGTNFIDIRADGVFVLHLKKGEIGEMKQLEGTWTLDHDLTFRASVSVNGNSIEQIATVTFDGDEMLLTDKDAQVTRHRRQSGELPPEYR